MSACKNEIIYYAVYFCGDEIPTALFTDEKEAVKYCWNVKNNQHWMDSEIRKINLATALSILDR